MSKVVLVAFCILLFFPSAFKLPAGTGMISGNGQYGLKYEVLQIKDTRDVEMNTGSGLDSGTIDLSPYWSNTNYVYDCAGLCSTCKSCPEGEWTGKFGGSLDVQLACDGGGMFIMKGDFTVDFLLADIKESDLPGGAVQDPDAFHFMNIPGAKTKVTWNNFTHQTCPKGCTARFNMIAPSYEFWTAWDWEVQQGDLVGINLRFQKLQENTPVFCGPQMLSNYNIYSAGIMALPMKHPNKFVPRQDDTMQRTWTDVQGPVRMQLRMTLQKDVP